MSGISDEDRLIQVLRQHKALKQWTIALLLQHGIDCQETYGNDANGDILVLRPEDSSRVCQLLEEVQQRFNPGMPQTTERGAIEFGNPHVEIKTQYLYGREVELIIQQGTVIGVVSAGSISQPSRLKLSQAGIAYAENVPLTEFMNELEE